MAKPKTIDEYLGKISPDRRITLEKLRRTIHAAVPGLEECISYSMPAFHFEGHVIAGFLATQQGCSYYPFSGMTLARLAQELATYGQTKSALHFDAKRSLPVALVRKLLRERIAEVPSKRARANDTVHKTKAGTKVRVKQG